MIFIGIISNHKDFEWITKKQNSNEKISYWLINEKSISNMKNITFETIVINQKLEQLNKYKEYIKKMVKKAKYLILNSDLKDNINILDEIPCKIITYGLNQKATITASSIGESNIIVCVQRKIETVNGNTKEVGEYNIKLPKVNHQIIYNTLANVSIKQLYDCLDD